MKSPKVLVRVFDGNGKELLTMSKKYENLNEAAQAIEYMSWNNLNWKFEISFIF